MMSEDMRGLFFVIKGQYHKGVEPRFINEATGDVSYVGGYDPRREETPQWYGLYDRETFECVACGGDLEKVVHGVYTQILHHKGVKSKYLRSVTHKGSPAMNCLHQAIYDNFGDYYEDLVERWEDEAYDYLREKNSKSGQLKRLKKSMKTKAETPAPTPQTTTEVTKKKPLRKTFKKRSL